MEYQRGALPLDEFNKTTPPGWDPSRAESYPLRAYIERLKLWGRLTDLRPDQVGVAVASRLRGRAYRLALSLKVEDPRAGLEYRGDDALAFAGHVADPNLGLPAVPSGFRCLIELLQRRYGAEEQKISTRSIEQFENLIRTDRMTLLEFLNELDMLYQQAEDLADYSLSPVALTHRLLKGARLPKEVVDHVLLLEGYDKRRFDAIYAHLMRRAKTAEPSQLPPPGSMYYADPEDDSSGTYYQYHDYDEWSSEFQYDETDWSSEAYFQDDAPYEHQDAHEPWTEEFEYADPYAYEYYEDQWYEDPESTYYGYPRPKGKGRGKGYGYRPSKGKGKGKSKAKGRLREPRPVYEADSLFGGKSKGKGKSKSSSSTHAGRSSGMMGCSNCGSSNHLDRDCPWSQSSSSASGSTPMPMKGKGKLVRLHTTPNPTATLTLRLPSRQTSQRLQR